MKHSLKAISSNKINIYRCSTCNNEFKHDEIVQHILQEKPLNNVKISEKDIDILVDIFKMGYKKDDDYLYDKNTVKAHRHVKKNTKVFKKIPCRLNNCKESFINKSLLKKHKEEKHSFSILPADLVIA